MMQNVSVGIKILTLKKAALPVFSETPANSGFYDQWQGFGFGEPARNFLWTQFS